MPKLYRIETGPIRDNGTFWMRLVVNNRLVTSHLNLYMMRKNILRLYK